MTASMTGWQSIALANGAGTPPPPAAIGVRPAGFLSGVSAGIGRGVVGFVLVVGLVGLLLWALVWWRRPPDADERWFRYGLAAAIVTLLAAFQATTGTLMEFPWLFFGTAIGVLYRRPPTGRAAREVLGSDHA